MSIYLCVEDDFQVEWDAGNSMGDTFGHLTIWKQNYYQYILTLKQKIRAKQQNSNGELVTKFAVFFCLDFLDQRSYFWLSSSP